MTNGLPVQEQSSRREIDDLKKQVQSSEALVADLKKKALQQRDLELDTARPKVSLTIVIIWPMFFFFFPCSIFCSALCT